MISKPSATSRTRRSSPPAGRARADRRPRASRRPRRSERRPDRQESRFLTPARPARRSRPPRPPRPDASAPIPQGAEGDAPPRGIHALWMALWPPMGPGSGRVSLRSALLATAASRAWTRPASPCRCASDGLADRLDEEAEEGRSSRKRTSVFAGCTLTSTVSGSSQRCRNATGWRPWTSTPR